MFKRLLKLSGIIGVTLILFFSLTATICSTSHARLDKEKNRRPLLRAMKIWESNHPSSERDATTVVLEYIPLNTPKQEALHCLLQNGFRPRVYETPTHQQAIEAVYTRNNVICKVDYSILLEVKDEKITKLLGSINHTCL